MKHCHVLTARTVPNLLHPTAHAVMYAGVVDNGYRFYHAIRVVCGRADSGLGTATKYAAVFIRCSNGC